MEQFDVVVVGARCAGSPLAVMLARRGLRVCVLDRARFPSDTPSTHVIQPCGVDVLSRLGVLDAILRAGAKPVERITFVVGDARVEAKNVEYGSSEFGLCVRRVVLDELLVDAAASAGADVRTGTTVTGLLREEGRIVGVESDAGPVRATLVVGADGRRSTLARLVGAREYHVVPPGRMFAWGYFEGVGETEGHLRLGRVGPLAFLSCPTDAGLFMAGIAPAMEDKHTFLADRERNFADGLRSWPEIGDLVDGASRVGPIRIVADWHSFMRTPFGPGWALVGDAGNFKDPTPAQGIADALRQNERLADTIEDGLGGVADLDQALREWGQWRDEDALEMHWFAADIGAPGRSSKLNVEIIREISHDAEATEGLMRVLNRELRPSELFTPGRLARAAARAMRRQPIHAGSVAVEVSRVVRTQVRRRREAS